MEKSQRRRIVVNVFQVRSTADCLLMKVDKEIEVLGVF